MNIGTCSEVTRISKCWESNYDLVAYARNHFEKKLFECNVDMCDKAFRKSTYLESSYDLVAYECNVDMCDKAFHISENSQCCNVLVCCYMSVTCYMHYTRVQNSNYCLHVMIYIMSQKNIHNIFSCNSRKHCFSLIK